MKTEESKSTDVRWATFGKVSAVVVLICTILGTLFAVFSYFAAKPDLEVYISSNEYRLPPPPQNDDQEIRRSSYADRYDGYFEVRVENEGGAQADNVVLDFPYNGIASIRPEDAEVSVLEFDGSVTIGSIRPKKRVNIYLWTTDDPASYKEDDIGLTHTTGLGSVHFEKRTYGFWSAVFQYIPGWLWFAIFMFSIWVLVLQSASRQEQLKKLQKQVDDLGVESTTGELDTLSTKVEDDRAAT